MHGFLTFYKIFSSAIIKYIFFFVKWTFYKHCPTRRLMFSFFHCVRFFKTVILKRLFFFVNFLNQDKLQIALLMIYLQDCILIFFNPLRHFYTTAILIITYFFMFFKFIFCGVWIEIVLTIKISIMIWWCFWKQCR